MLRPTVCVYFSVTPAVTPLRGQRLADPVMPHRGQRRLTDPMMPHHGRRRFTDSVMPHHGRWMADSVMPHHGRYVAVYRFRDAAL